MQNRPPPFRLASQASSECICLPVARCHMPAMPPPLCAWTVHAEPMDPLFSLRFNTPITHRLLRDLSSQLRVSFFPSPLIHAFLRKCTRVHRRSCSAQVKLLTLSLLARCSCDLFFPSISCSLCCLDWPFFLLPLLSWCWWSACVRGKTDVTQRLHFCGAAVAGLLQLEWLARA